MRSWGLMLGGFLIWTLHFLLIYGAASVADISAPSLEPTLRWGAALLTLGCLIGIVVLVRQAGRKPGGELARQIGLGACVISGVAIVWQALPIVTAA